MATIYDLKRRAKELAAATETNAVDPASVGNLIDDTLELIDEYDKNVVALGIRKTYATVAAMEADKTSPSGDNGKKLRFGQLVSVYDTGNAQAVDNGKVFAFQNPGWKLSSRVDAGYATIEKVSELSATSDILDNRIAVIEKMVTGDKIDYSGEELSEPLIVDSKNGFLNASTSTLAATSNYLYCEGARYVELSVAVGVGVISAGIAFYDESGKYISGVARPVETLGRMVKKYAIPENAYSFRTTYLNKANREVYGEFYCIVHYKEGLAPSYKVDDFDSSILIDGYNIDGISGVVGNSLIYSATGFVSCRNASEIELMMPLGVTNGTGGIAFFDEQFKYVRGVVRNMADKNGAEKRILKLSGDEIYFKTCFWNSENRKKNGEFYCRVKYEL